MVDGFGGAIATLRWSFRSPWGYFVVVGFGLADSGV